MPLKRLSDLKQSDEVQTAATVPAKVTVRLPEYAKLYVDGVLQAAASDGTE